MNIDWLMDCDFSQAHGKIRLSRVNSPGGGEGGWWMLLCRVSQEPASLPGMHALWLHGLRTWADFVYQPWLWTPASSLFGIERRNWKSSGVTTKNELCSSTPGKSCCRANVRLLVPNTVTVLGAMFCLTSRGLGGQRSQGWEQGPCGGTHLATVDERQYRASSHNGNSNRILLCFNRHCLSYLIYNISLTLPTLQAIVYISWKPPFPFIQTHFFFFFWNFV